MPSTPGERVLDTIVSVLSTRDISRSTRNRQGNAVDKFVSDRKPERTHRRTAADTRPMEEQLKDDMGDWSVFYDIRAVACELRLRDYFDLWNVPYTEYREIISRFEHL